MSPVNTIFVDSDAFIALAKEDDDNHVRAFSSLENLSDKKVHFITSNYVFSEVVTVLSLRISQKAALTFTQLIKSPETVYDTVWIDEQIEKEALDIFANQSSKNVSLVDCTNMAVMNLKHIRTIFSFDEVYKKNGYILL